MCWLVLSSVNMKQFVVLSALVSCALGAPVADADADARVLLAKPYINSGSASGPLTPLVGDLVATNRGYASLSLEGFSEDVNEDGFVDPIAHAPAVAAYHVAAPAAVKTVEVKAAPAVAVAPVAYHHVATAPVVHQVGYQVHHQVHHVPQVTVQKHTSTHTTPQPVKLSVAPKYSPQTRSQQARSTRKPITPTPTPIRSYTFTPVYKERSTTPRYSTTRATTLKPTSIKTLTTRPSYQSQFSRNNLSKRVIYSSHEYQDTQDWLPVTTPPPPTNLIRKQASKPPINYNSPEYYNAAPTPYSLFQSVPENIGETDVFHLSQNVDFGKKLETDNPVLNEVDHGYRGPVSVHKLVSTRPPRKVAKARGALDGLIPSLFSHKRDETRSRKSRGRCTVRRRRPKHIQPAADRL